MKEDEQCAFCSTQAAKENVKLQKEALGVVYKDVSKIKCYLPENRQRQFELLERYPHLNQICKQLTESLNNSMYPVIFSLTNEKKRFVPIASNYFPTCIINDEADLMVDMKRESCRRIFAGQEMITEDVSKDMRWSTEDRLKMLGRKVHSIWVFPIQTIGKHSELIGSLCLLGSEPTIYTFEDGEQIKEAVKKIQVNFITEDINLICCCETPA